MVNRGHAQRAIEINIIKYVAWNLGLHVKQWVIQGTKKAMVFHSQPDADVINDSHVFVTGTKENIVVISMVSFTLCQTKNSQQKLKNRIYNQFLVSYQLL